MLRSALSLVLLAGLVACGTDAPVEEPILLAPYVDPMIGTGGTGFSIGAVAPGPTFPFGLAKPSPDTSVAGGQQAGFWHCSGYYHPDDEIRAFSQIHLEGTGIPDYGALGVMPSRGLSDDRVRPRDYIASFDHVIEDTSVGRYGVELIDQAIRVEVRATPRTSLYRFDYRSDAPKTLVVNLDHFIGTGETLDGEIRYDGDRELSGWLLHAGDISGRFGGFRLYFAMRLERAPARVDAFGPDGTLSANATAGRSGMILRLADGGDLSLGLQLGLSFVDEAGAKKNLDAEWMDFDLDLAEQKTLAAWEPVLDKVMIEGGPESVMRRFYTALLHVHHMPTKFTDADRRYRGFDDAIHQAEDFEYYTDFSLWDTFRSTHPLYSLLEPSVQADMNRSLLLMKEQGGHLPRWALATGYTGTMIGNHGETMLIDAYLKGVGGFDPEPTYQFLAAWATGTQFGTKPSSRECYEDWISLGYCSDRVGSSVSRSMENSINDWALANLARALGHQDEADLFVERSHGWRNHMNPETGYAETRTASGTWAHPGLNPGLHDADDYTEGNARQWTLYPYHDVEKLTELVGGRDAMLARLEEMFEGAVAEGEYLFPSKWYWHGNEPNIHQPYLFAELGRPDLTQRWVRWAMDTHYKSDPDGFDGNDDGGTLSAWYVFSALGFYPKAGSSQYVLGAPRFAKATVTREDGSTLTIIADGYAEDAIYAKRVELDGVRLTSPIIQHADLAGAKELRFFMTTEPSPQTFD